MQIYLVGGAVRDILLGLTPKDRDWVVINSSPKKMLDLGFIKIDADFPIFIHPKTKEEYALARAEKKVSAGYKGFLTLTKNVSLIDDLKRRDLTINSIAMDTNGNIIDPFYGQQDINNRVLRHTSKAFHEDPLRAIRLARLKAQLSDFNFQIANETKKLVIQMLHNGEINHLKKERLGIEFKKSLKNPYIFFNTLKELKILDPVFPTIGKHLINIPQNICYSNLYINSPLQTKLSYTLLQLPLDTTNDLKLELNLTNKETKLVYACQCIFKLISSSNPTNTEILNLIKQSQVLRDNKLLKEVFITINLFTYTNTDRFYTAKTKLLENLIFDLKHIDYKSIAHTKSNNIKETIIKAQLFCIKKYF